MEIEVSGQPVFAPLVQQGRDFGDEAQAGRGVGEDRRDESASIDLEINAFEAVRGAQPSALAKRLVALRAHCGVA